MGRKKQPQQAQEPPADKFGETLLDWKELIEAVPKGKFAAIFGQANRVELAIRTLGGLLTAWRRLALAGEAETLSQAVIDLADDWLERTADDEAAALAKERADATGGGNVNGEADPTT